MTETLTPEQYIRAHETCAATLGEWFGRFEPTTDEGKRAKDAFESITAEFGAPQGDGSIDWKALHDSVWGEASRRIESLEKALEQARTPTCTATALAYARNLGALMTRTLGPLEVRVSGDSLVLELRMPLGVLAYAVVSASDAQWGTRLTTTIALRDYEAAMAEASAVLAPLSLMALCASAFLRTLQHPA